jgi:flagellar motility protein MotE (MotC chaperone)
MSILRDIRVLPVVLTAIFGLAVLKFAGIVIDGGYVFDYPTASAQASSRAPAKKKSWAQENFNFPVGGSASDAEDITGSIDTKPKDSPSKNDGASAQPSSPPQAAKPETTRPGGTVLLPDPEKPISASERAILERLQARRQELDARAREIDIRENLLKAAEQRIAGKVKELKEVEASIATKTQQRNEAEAARFRSLVKTYEAMKPKDAAKVFDRLEMPVLYEIASQISPRNMSDILGQMSPEAAERLTVEMARRASGDKTASAADLPKIEGRPTPPQGTQQGD